MGTTMLTCAIVGVIMLHERTMITANRNRGKIVFENYSIRRVYNAEQRGLWAHEECANITDAQFYMCDIFL